MSSQQIKTRLLAIGIIITSACGTLALFGCVPVLAKIGAAAPFSIDQIEAFLLQQANLPNDLPSADPTLPGKSDRAMPNPPQ